MNSITTRHVSREALPTGFTPSDQTDNDPRRGEIGLRLPSKIDAFSRRIPGWIKRVFYPRGKESKSIWTRKLEIENLNIFLVDDTFDTWRIDGRKEGGNPLRSNSFLLLSRVWRWIKWSAPFPEKKGEKYANIRCYVERKKEFFLSNAPATMYERPKYIQSQRIRLSFITFHFISLRQSVALCFIKW